ncbi:hypothetical protein AVEN_35138-1 [Araneus ventricosus]|uniref:Uncharacterized protein n=1 Tax=Araneus ventricosus TaxID=182803 RepID=A0A4Y2TZZ8_ARAVE|nr:hypothetical protein AVEN_35138-1 [Araneus ventricosus]
MVWKFGDGMPDQVSSSDRGTKLGGQVQESARPLKITNPFWENTKFRLYKPEEASLAVGTSILEHVEPLCDSLTRHCIYTIYFVQLPINLSVVTPLCPQKRITARISNLDDSCSCQDIFGPQWPGGKVSTSGRRGPGSKPDSTQKTPCKRVRRTLNPSGQNVLPLVWCGSCERGRQPRCRLGHLNLELGLGTTEGMR